MTEKVKRRDFYNKAVFQTFFLVLAIGVIIWIISLKLTSSNNQAELDYRTAIIRVVADDNHYLEIVDEEAIKIGNYIRKQTLNGVALDSIIDRAAKLKAFLDEVEQRNGGGTEGKKRKQMAFQQRVDAEDLDWALFYMADRPRWLKFGGDPENIAMIQALLKDPETPIQPLEFKEEKISAQWLWLCLGCAQFFAVIAYLIKHSDERKYHSNIAKWYQVNWYSLGTYITIIFLLPGAASIIVPTALIRSVVFVYRSRSKRSVYGNLSEMLESKNLEKSHEDILRTLEEGGS